MLVSKRTLCAVLDVLRGESYLSVDTETTGLRAYHGHRPFGISIATSSETYYFNLQAYPGLSEELLLDRGDVFGLDVILRGKYLFFHNYKFDAAMLANVGIRIQATIHDTKVAERLLCNNLLSYSLDSVAKRYGFTKDSAVEKYVKEHKLHTVVVIPGKAQKAKQLHYDKVPFDLMVKYAENDARITFDIGMQQLGIFRELRKGVGSECRGSKPVSSSASAKGVWLPFEHEKELSPILFDIEQRGVAIDRPYCLGAIAHEEDRMRRAKEAFFLLTSSRAISSRKLFLSLFQGEKWVYGKATPTGKVNPSFDSDVLSTFKHPAAKVVLDYRDAKSRSDYFQGFLYHADAQGVLHPSFDQAGTATGRFSSQNPNCQNMSKEKEYAGEFPVRRALVPRRGYYFLIFDMDQAEYRLLLDHCNAKGLIAKIKAGLDVHEATAELAGITRDQAKTTNFAVLYGAGDGKLSKSLGVTYEKAQAIRRAIFAAAPEMEAWMRAVQQTAQTRKWVQNWTGRKSYFPDPKFAYQAVNYIIQGGVADIVKLAMVNFTKEKAQKPPLFDVNLVLNVHDELVFEVPLGLDSPAALILDILEGSYPHRHLPLTWGCSHSLRSLYDKTKGLYRPSDNIHKPVKAKGSPVIDLALPPS